MSAEDQIHWHAHDEQCPSNCGARELSLDALAAEEQSKHRRGGVICWVCDLPEREWLERKRKEGMTYPVLLSVLRKTGHEGATIHRLRGHFQNHV